MENKTKQNTTWSMYLLFKFIFKEHRDFFLFLKMVLHFNRGHMLLGHHPLQPQKPVPVLITYLCEKNVIKQQLGFWLIFSDICIGIHPKDFWCRVQRQSLCVFDVAFVLQRWKTKSQEVRNQLSCRNFSLKRDNFQYSSYWVDKPVKLDTECFHFLSTWGKVFFF